jgi:hypothetical protein
MNLSEENNKKLSTFTNTIIKSIEKKIQRQITIDEENYIIEEIKNTPKDHFYNYSSNVIANNVIDNTTKYIYSNFYKNNNVNTHELLKNIIDPTNNFDKPENNDNDVNLRSIFGYTDIATIVKKVNEPISSINSSHMYLDTRYRELDNDGTTFFSWGHINNLVRNQGTVNTIGNIRDIISMNIMSYRMPAVASAITPYNRIAVTIDEFIPQSFVAHEQRRFHFICKIDSQVGNWLEIISDDFNKGVFKFNKPVTHLDSITIRFGSPLEPIIFDKDRLPGTITYANPTVIDFSENHNLTTNDIVYIDTFDVNNVPRNITVRSTIKSINGNVATVVNPTQITIPTDSSSIVSVLTGTITAPSITPAGNVNVVINTDNITGLGTNFTVNFVVGDYIQIQNNVNNPILQIKSIQSNTNLTLETNYTDVSGIFIFRRTKTVLVGVGTLFTTELVAGDRIIIADNVNNPQFIVSSVQNNTNLTLTTPYNGLNGVGLNATKNNSISPTFTVYFGSKRIFIPLEFIYLAS